jgi:hypothetical protein
MNEKLNWITRDALQLAMSIVYEHLQDEYPEDKWEVVGDTNTDLNLWTNDIGVKFATLYPIVDGDTITNTWVAVFQQGGWSEL